MPEPRFPDLRVFLDTLRRDRDLAVVEAPVDADQEAAEIHRRVIAAGGPALLFRNVRVGPGGAGGAAAIPLVTNLFGTARRAELAFGRRPMRLVRRLVELATTLLPPTPSKLWGARDLAREALRIGTRPVGSGPVLDVVEREPRLDRLPAITSWPEDGGPFVTLPLVYTEAPLHAGAPAPRGSKARGRVGASNLAMYRMHVHGPRETGMHWQIGKGGGFHYKVAEERGEALPVTVFLGGPPALTLAAVAPLPENVPEIILASLLAGERVRLAPAPGGLPPGLGSHPLVAEAELALVGSVAPGVRRPEGPFGDHYGYYSLQHPYPVFEVAALCRRRDAMLPATVVGKPRQEDFYIGDLLQELLSPLFPLVMPGVRSLWSYGETGYHALAAAVVQERYRREAMASAFRILGEGQLALTKFLLVLDRPVDLRDFRGVLEHLLARSRPEQDLFLFDDLAMDTLDYTGPRVNEGSKGIWLGLGEPLRELPGELRLTVEPPPGTGEIHVFCRGCLVVGAPSFADDPGAAARLAAHPAFADWPLLVVTDEPRRAARSAMNFLWTTFTRFEPAADIHAARREMVRNRVRLSGPIAIDARTKPGLPGELFCREDVARRVTERWKEYFPAGGVEMGSSDLAHLDPA